VVQFEKKVFAAAAPDEKEPSKEPPEQKQDKEALVEAQPGDETSQGPDRHHTWRNVLLALRSGVRIENNSWFP
jgi:hypothetical protein